MARFSIQLLVIVILASFLELLLPWWSVAVAAFVGGLIFRSGQNFIAGFLSIALLWLVTAIVIDTSSAAPLAERVARIFTVDKLVLFVITTIIGGLIGGFAATAGSALRKEKRRIKYY